MSIQSLSLANTATQCVCIITTNDNNEREVVAVYVSFLNVNLFGGEFYWKFNTALI